MQVLDAFLVTLETGYSKYSNPYHNLVHAADVTATSNFFLAKFKLVVRPVSPLLSYRCSLTLLCSPHFCSLQTTSIKCCANRRSAELALGARDLRDAVRRADPRLRAHGHHQHVPHQLLVRPTPTPTPTHSTRPALADHLSLRLTASFSWPCRSAAASEHRRSVAPRVPMPCASEPNRTEPKRTK